MKAKILILTLFFSLLPFNSAFADEPLVFCDSINITSLSRTQFRLQTSHRIDPNQQLDETEFWTRTVYNISTTSLNGLTEPDETAATYYSEYGSGHTLDDTIDIEINTPGQYYVKAFISFALGSTIEFHTSGSCQKILTVQQRQPSCEDDLSKLIELLGDQAQAVQFYQDCHPADPPIRQPSTGSFTSNLDGLQFLGTLYLPAAIITLFLLRFITKRKNR